MDEVLRAKRQQNASATRAITIRGAREHNLKNVDVEIPRDRLDTGSTITLRQQTEPSASLSAMTDRAPSSSG